MTFGLPEKGQVNGMFEAENIRDWREHDVIDPDGKKIGQLEAVYVDTTTDEPAFGSIRIGVMGRRRLTFVPLDRAVVLPGQLRVAYPKSQVKDALTIDTDGELLAGDEPELFKHYGLEYSPGEGGERQLARRLAAARRPGHQLTAGAQVLAQGVGCGHPFTVKRNVSG
jgi:PRC-barrel domain